MIKFLFLLSIAVTANGILIVNASANGQSQQEASSPNALDWEKANQSWAFLWHWLYIPENEKFAESFIGDLKKNPEYKKFLYTGSDGQTKLLRPQNFFPSVEIRDKKNLGPELSSDLTQLPGFLALFDEAKRAFCAVGDRMETDPYCHGQNPESEWKTRTIQYLTQETHPAIKTEKDLIRKSNHLLALRQAECKNPSAVTLESTVESLNSSIKKIYGSLLSYHGIESDLYPKSPSYNHIQTDLSDKDKAKDKRDLALRRIEFALALRRPLLGSKAAPNPQVGDTPILPELPPPPPVFLSFNKPVSVAGPEKKIPSPTPVIAPSPVVTSSPVVPPPQAVTSAPAKVIDVPKKGTTPEQEDRERELRDLQDPDLLEGNKHFADKSNLDHLKKAIEHYLNAAKKGNVAAESKLRDLYSSPNSENLLNMDMVLKCYTTAANSQNNPFAKFQLAEWYQFGIEGKISKNHEEAIKWYKKANEENQYAPAQNALGILYEAGVTEGGKILLPQDYEKARQLYQKSVHQNYAEANRGLYRLYSEGHGVPKNSGKAKEYEDKIPNPQPIDGLEYR